MSAAADVGTTNWRTSDWYAARARRGMRAAGTVAIAVAIAYVAAILSTGGAPSLLIPLAGALVGLAILVRPVIAVYALFGAALLFEQTEVPGVASFTDQSHVFQRIDMYTGIPVPLSIAELLMLLAVAGWGVKGLAGKREALRMGHFGWAVAGYGAAFMVGTAVGIARGPAWDASAAIAEVRAPFQMCVLYFLATNLIRDRRQLAVVMWEFVVLVAVKALQGIWGYTEGQSLSYALDAVTGHEDVVFFDLAIALLAIMALLGVRTKLFFALLATMPLIMIAELLTQRRVAFIALGTVLLVILLLAFARDPRRALFLATAGALLVAAYVQLFWDESGVLAQPIRALRAAFDPTSVSARDLLSDHWRIVEIRNIEYTVSQLPFTGVGTGRELLLKEQPPTLLVADWKYITHQAVLWLWLKAGALGAFALWFLVARVALVGSALWVRLRDPELRWVAVLPVALISIQIIFSSIDMGLTHSRTMIVLGTVLGVAAAILAKSSAGPARGLPEGGRE